MSRRNPVMNRVADTLEMMRQQDESIARSMDVQLAEGGFGVITANAHNGEDILYTCGLSWKQCTELIMAFLLDVDVLDRN